MEAAGKALSYSWVVLLPVLIFFFNTAPFPGGLSLSLVLTPVWIYLLYEWKQPVRKPAAIAGLVVLVFGVVHVSMGIIPHYYIISTVLLLATAIFCLVAWLFFSYFPGQLDAVFRNLLVLNFLFALLSLALLFTPVRDIVWYTMSISQDVEPIPRLKLFTAEASHYSYLLAPLVIYFSCRMMFFGVTEPWVMILLVFFPLALSFSLGVTACIAITGMVMLVLYLRTIFSTRRRRLILLGTILALAVLAILVYLVLPDNPLYHRIANVLGNKDTSARGRTYESFILAHKIIAQKSFLFGIGPGQMKVEGRNIIIQYYQYMKIPPVVRIPNACADTIVCYGYIGLALRLGLQGYLFIKTKVRDNPFRLWLFLFLILYQFTGSYITNAAEYLLWALVFAPVFPDMNKTEVKQK